jgi:hypothetical protein
MPGVPIDDTAPNAFATGRDPAHASVAITRSLLQELDGEGRVSSPTSCRVHLRHPVLLIVSVMVGSVALLAGGVDPLELGPEVDTATLVRPQLLGFERDGTVLGAIVQHIDRFGNVQLSAGRDAVADVFRAGGVAEVEALDDRYLAVCADTFADVQRGELVLYEDSEQRLSIAINRGDAAELLDLTAGSHVRIEFAPTIEA